MFRINSNNNDTRNIRNVMEASTLVDGGMMNKFDFQIESIRDYANILRILKCFRGDLKALRNNDEAFLENISKKIWNFGKLIVLRMENEILGFSAFYCNDKESLNAYISLIAVDSKYRKLGLGKAILEEIYSVAIQNGMQNVRLEVDNDNTVALSFYKKNGFVMEEKCTESTVFMIRDLL